MNGLVVAVPAERVSIRVSLDLVTGDLAAVPARPAAGTALARVVAGLAAPVAGRVLVGSRDVTDLPAHRRQIGYVPAGGGLLPHLTARQNIEYGLRRRDELVLDLFQNWQQELIVQLELGSVLDRRPHELTAERRLRVALARAAVGLPEVLVIDLPDAAAAGGALPELLDRAQSRHSRGDLTTLVVTADEQILTRVDRRFAAQPLSAQKPAAQEPDAQEPDAQEPRAEKPGAQRPDAQAPGAPVLGGESR